ncbi:MAG TPA: response regulator [Rhizomicrobium sp.]|jgi:CheY-like chemotaxis protein|nr:response regulator [Rhizomicrobium sp.]
MTVVLVVEDEFLIRMNTVDMVEDAGYDTLEASNADEALEILDHHSEIAIVFTDINMPGSINGIELAETIAEHWPGIRVVLTSGRYLMRDENLPDDDRFILKPFDGVQLTNVLRGLVH